MADLDATTSLEKGSKADNTSEMSSETVDENDGWMDILGSGQLKKKIIKEGEADSRPNRGYICHLRLEAKLESGIVVEKEDDFVVQLGDAEVIQGLDLAIPLMNVGEHALVEVNARFGYGKLGKAPDIPPSATLLYTLELLSAEPEPDLEDLTVTQRKKIGAQKRERGNWWYSREEHSLAIQCYRKALEFLDEAQGGITAGDDPSGAVSQELRELIDDRLKVYNNLAAAQMKIKAFDTALQSVENVLRCQPNNVKALFRKGKILSEKGENEKAVEVLRDAIKLEPENKLIHQELSRMLARSKQDKTKEKSLYRKMLGQDKVDSESTSGDSRTSVRFSWGLLAGSVAALATGIVLYRFRPF